MPVLVVETQMGGPATEIITREVLDESFHPTPPTAVVQRRLLRRASAKPRASARAGRGGVCHRLVRSALQQAEGGVLAAFGGVGAA